MNSRFCYATLAFNKPYRDMAKLLAADLATYAPGHALVVATDAVDEFKGFANVVAYPHHITGFFRCINDKRFAVAFALENHAEEVLFIDADSRVHEPLPLLVGSDAKIVTAYAPPLAEQATKWLLPQYGRAVLSAARAFGVDPTQTKFVMDNIFAVKRDHGREKVFIQVWDHVTRLFDFQGVDITDGYCMSIAAAVTGWVPSDTGIGEFARLMEHHAASAVTSKKSLFASVTRRVTLPPKLMIHRLKAARSIRVPPSI